MIPLVCLSLLILLAAVGAVWKSRAVHAALLLALALGLNAVLYISLGADFIGLVQFMVYVGAVAVIIVFSLLITRQGDETEETAMRPRSMVTGLLCVLPVLLILIGIIAKMENSPNTSSVRRVVSVEKLGQLLFTTHAPAVVAVGVLLTSVMIGAALLARDSGRKSETDSGK